MNKQVHTHILLCHDWGLRVVVINGNPTINWDRWLVAKAEHPKAPPELPPMAFLVRASNLRI